jgi:predicted XRE-type DNA-binding protein
MKQERFASVWDAIEPSGAEAASMKARSKIMIAIRETVEAWSMTQSAAAKRLGLTQPRMNDLLRGRIDKFSLDALINLATRADLAVRVEVVCGRRKPQKLKGHRSSRAPVVPRGRAIA